MIEDHQTELTAAFDENRVAMAPALGTSHGIDLSTVKFQPPQKLRKSLLKRAFSQGFGLSREPDDFGGQRNAPDIPSRRQHQRKRPPVIRGAFTDNQHSYKNRRKRTPPQNQFLERFDKPLFCRRLLKTVSLIDAELLPPTQRKINKRQHEAD